MKKRVLLTILVITCLLTLSACGCKHETWNEANCINPKTCAECGETEGAPLGHSWMAATCDTVKTCEVCGETEGEALGHSWTEASCAAPKTCANCGKTEGEALEHIWLEATTEAPKTCELCGETEGEKIDVDARFTTAATKDLHGKWVSTLEVTGEMMDLPDLDAVLTCEIVMELTNDGQINISMSIVNEDEFKSAMLPFLADTLYAELATSGYDKEAADTAFQQIYGMTIEEFAAIALETLDFSELIGDISIEGVYYVADGSIYAGDDWNSAMSPTAYTLDGDTLTLDDDLSGTGASTTTVFTRVAE